MVTVIDIKEGNIASVLRVHSSKKLRRIQMSI